MTEIEKQIWASVYASACARQGNDPAHLATIASEAITGLRALTEAQVPPAAWALVLEARGESPEP